MCEAWMHQIPTDTKVLRKWLKAGYVENRTLFPTEAGTPQGGIISPTLANMTSDGLEQLLKVAFRRRRDGARQYRLKVNLIRYADVPGKFNRRLLWICLRQSFITCACSA
jgi:RNA-directed DNA polymerase